MRKLTPRPWSADGGCKHCSMCVANYSAVSVPMLLAPARDPRLSCAQCRRHTSVWSDSRSVRRTNDAGSPAHGQTPAPLISVSALTHISVSLLVWKMSEPAACVLPCYAQGRAEFRKDRISFSFSFALEKEIILFVSRKLPLFPDTCKHTMDCRWILRECGNHKPELVTAAIMPLPHRRRCVKLTSLKSKYCVLLYALICFDIIACLFSWQHVLRKQW